MASAPSPVPAQGATPTTARRRRLPARFAWLVMPLLLSVLMTAVVSMVSSFRTLGPVPGFWRVWLGAWGWSWLVAFPTLLLALPLVRRMTAALVEPA